MTLEKNKAKVDEASRLTRLGELVTKRDMKSFNEFSGSSSGSTTITTDDNISRMIGLTNLRDNLKIGSTIPEPFE